jgi:uncharacterized membrane protein (UPF0136 family)
MGWLNAVLVAYAALNVAGGILGYVKAQSVPSVISGVVIGVLLLASVAISRGNAVAGYVMAAVVTVLTLAWSVKALISRSDPFWIVMIVASVVVLVCLAVGHLAERA